MQILLRQHTAVGHGEVARHFRVESAAKLLRLESNGFAGPCRLFDRQKSAHVGQTFLAVGFGSRALRDAVREIGDLPCEMVDLTEGLALFAAGPTYCHLQDRVELECGVKDQLGLRPHDADRLGLG